MAQNQQVQGQKVAVVPVAAAPVQKPSLGSREMDEMTLRNATIDALAVALERRTIGVEAVAKKYKIHPHEVRKLCRDNKIHAVQLGGHLWLIEEESVARYTGTRRSTKQVTDLEEENKRLQAEIARIKAERSATTTAAAAK